MSDEAKFFEKLNQRRSGTPKTARRSTCAAKQLSSTANGTTQRTLFESESSAPEPIPSAEQQWYQRTCDELPPEQRDRFICLVQQLAAKG